MTYVSNPFQVKDKRRRHNQSSWAVLTIVLAIVVGITSIIIPLSSSRLALAGSELPSDSFFAEGSLLSPANNLYTPDVWIKLDFDTPGVKQISFFDGKWDGSGPADLNSPSTFSNDYHYDIVAANASEQPATILCTLQQGGNVTGPASPGPGCGNITMPVNAWGSDLGLMVDASTKSSISGRYILLVHGYFNNNASRSSGQINAFKVRTTTAGGHAGLWTQSIDPTSPTIPMNNVGSPPNVGQVAVNSQYAFQERTCTSTCARQTDFYFAPPCNFTVDKTVYIKWADADSYNPPGWGTFNWPGSPDTGYTTFPTGKFELYQIDPTGVQTLLIKAERPIDSAGNPVPGSVNIGAHTGREGQLTGRDSLGQNVDSYESAPFTAKKGYTYKWHWENVNPNNGIQLWTPFDSYNAEPDVACPNYSLSANIAPGVNLPASGGVIYTNQNYGVNPSVTNAGPSSNTDDVFLEVLNQNQPYVQNVAYTGPGVGPPDPTGTNYLNNCFPATDTPTTPVCSVPGNMHWVYYYGHDRLGSGQTSTPSFTFKLDPATTPDGASVCFKSVVTPKHGGTKWPSDGANTTSSASICYVASNPSFPYVDTTKGDVHAGGGVGSDCAPGPGSGNITGQFQAKFQVPPPGAEYIVSSSGPANNFASRAGANFGNAGTGYGYYGAVCRPNLAINAENYPSSKKVIWTGSPSYGVNPALMNTSGTIYQVNGDATINTGTITSRVTLYVKGDLTIYGPLTYASGNYTADNQPSLGVIVTGNIYVKGSANKLDGFYSAGNSSTGGDFDTCKETTVAACHTVLTINGLIMGHHVYLRRTTIGAPGSTALSEQVNFTGLLYISTPPGFEQPNDASNNLPSFFGDRPPVF